MNKLKHLHIILLIIIALINTPAAAAQSPTKATTPSPTIDETLNEKLNTQINQLKEKIASRVTELKLVEKRGVIGTVTDSSTNRITITDLQGKTRLIDVDEITKFSSLASKTFGLSDLTKGTKVTVLGLYNKESKKILARFISTSVNPVFLTGGISEIDSRNFVITVTSNDDKKTKIDVGTTTKISTSGTDGLLTKTTFSKLLQADRVSVVGFPDKTDPTLIIAQRIIVLTDVVKDPGINITLPSPTTLPTAIPTTLQRRVIQAPIVATPSARRPSPIISR